MASLRPLHKLTMFLHLFSKASNEVLRLLVQEVHQSQKCVSIGKQMAESSLDVVVNLSVPSHTTPFRYSNGKKIIWLIVRFVLYVDKRMLNDGDDEDYLKK